MVQLLKLSSGELNSYCLLCCCCSCACTCKLVPIILRIGYCFVKYITVQGSATEVKSKTACCKIEPGCSQLSTDFHDAVSQLNCPRENSCTPCSLFVAAG